MFIASTPSNADLPFSGALAACAEIPLNVNLPDLLELLDCASAENSVEPDDAATPLLDVVQCFGRFLYSL